MEIKKLMICSASQKKEGEFTSLQKSLIRITPKIDLIPFFIKENKEGLATVYNLAINKALRADVDALVLVHDDVTLECDLVYKLERAFDLFDLVGVAGTSKIELKEPTLWHIMGGGFGSGNLHGAVAHGTKEQKMMTGFGVYPHRCILIDGVFMALNRNVMENMRFDEDCPSKFHFYDLNFSMDCCNAKLKVGVGDIMITHESPGLREFTEDWKQGQRYFLNKYEN